MGELLISFCPFLCFQNALKTPRCPNTRAKTSVDALSPACMHHGIEQCICRGPTSKYRIRLFLIRRPMSCSALPPSHSMLALCSKFSPAPSATQITQCPFSSSTVSTWLHSRSTVKGASGMRHTSTRPAAKNGTASHNRDAAETGPGTSQLCPQSGCFNGNLQHWICCSMHPAPSETSQEPGSM